MFGVIATLKAKSKAVSYTSRLVPSSKVHAVCRVEGAARPRRCMVAFKHANPEVSMTRHPGDQYGRDPIERTERG
jgi:hypothetical protein